MHRSIWATRREHQARLPLLPLSTEAQLRPAHGKGALGGQGDGVGPSAVLLGVLFFFTVVDGACWVCCSRGLAAFLRVSAYSLREAIASEAPETMTFQATMLACYASRSSSGRKSGLQKKKKKTATDNGAAAVEQNWLGRQLVLFSLTALKDISCFETVLVGIRACLSMRANDSVISTRKTDSELIDVTEKLCGRRNNAYTIQYNTETYTWPATHTMSSSAVRRRRRCCSCASPGARHAPALPCPIHTRCRHLLLCHLHQGPQPAHHPLTPPSLVIHFRNECRFDVVVSVDGALCISRSRN